MRKKPTGYSSTTPVSAVSDAVTSESNGAGTTTSTYDHRGRRKTVDAPNTTAAAGTLLANVTNTLYFPDGSVQETNGDQTYRTAYTYDYAARMKTIATYRISGLADTTTWNYESWSGRLSSKRDAMSLGPSYTYGYTSGFQTFTNYRDITPDVTTTYDALGRVSTITQASQSKIAYAYDPADLALGTETVSYDLDHNGTDEFTRTLDRSHDTLGRNTGYDLKNGAAVEFSAIATDHPLSGRPFTVANGTQSFTYGYQPSSHLIVSVTAGTDAQREP